MGITARGAWESVKRHFRELGVELAEVLEPAPDGWDEVVGAE